MEPSMPERAPGGARSSLDLPYGPLPVRARRRFVPSDSPPLDEFVDLSWLNPDPPGPPAEVVDETDSTTDVDPAEPSTGLSLTSPRPEADDDVHFGVAARALGVSRKTVERMVRRGQLDRGPSDAPATVSKRSLVAVLEQRRRDVSHLTRATELEQTKSGNEWLSAEPSGDPGSALRDALAPLLAPLLEEFVAVRTRAAVLESQLESMQARAEQSRERDELVLELITRGRWGWPGRRKTPDALIRHYVLGGDGSSGDVRSLGAGGSSRDARSPGDSAPD